MKRIIFLAAFVFCTNAHAVEISKSSTDIPYGFASSGKGAPLAIIFTTSIEESLADVYTPLGSQLKKQGFSLLSLDVPCHGRDVRRGEVAGLDCWALRVKHGDVELFDNFSRKVDEIVGQLVRQGAIDPSFIVAIGVSRGGYLALRQMALSRFVNAVVGLAPVTDLKKLAEFRDTAVDQRKFGFANYYATLAGKKVFVQIGNNDDRVGTQGAVDLINNIVAAKNSQDVDATLMLMPFKGHGTSKDSLALDWIIQQRTKNNNRSIKKAP